MNPSSSVKIAMVLGSALTTQVVQGFDCCGVDLLPIQSYLTPEMFADEFDVKTSISSDVIESDHIDRTMAIPVIKKMRLRFKKPVKKDFVF